MSGGERCGREVGDLEEGAYVAAPAVVGAHRLERALGCSMTKAPADGLAAHAPLEHRAGCVTGT